MLLAGKVAVVSGVGPGLGREIALACAREGAAVALGARRGEFLDEVAAQIVANGGKAAAIPTDITDAAQCRALVAATIERFGGLDVLVNSAFRPDVYEPFESVDLDRWREIVDVNLFGSLQLTQVAVPALKARGGGSIVFVNSMVVRRPRPLEGGYAVSKGALLVAARVLARELGRHHIRVNSVVPGWMWGPPVEGYVRFRAERKGVAEQAVIDEITANIPLGVIPDDADCAGAVVFLASDLAAAVTGQALDVNGGEVFD